MKNLPRRVLIAPIRFYQRAISPLRMPTCRFYPTCSEYALESIQRHGAVRGTGYAVVRLLKCGPWHPGGVDKVRPSRGAPAEPTRVDRAADDRAACRSAAPEDLETHRQPGVI